MGKKDKSFSSNRVIIKIVLNLACSILAGLCTNRGEVSTRACEARKRAVESREARKEMRGKILRFLSSPLSHT